MEPQTLFSQNTIHHITIYNQAAQTESHTGGDINVKFTPTQKTAIQAICKDHGLKVSAFIREMVDTFLELFQYRDKIKRHKDRLIDFLKILP